MGTDKPARAVEAFQRFAGMQLLNTGMHGEVASLLPDPDHSLLDFMVRICDPALDLNVTPEFEVSFVGAAAVDVIRAGKTVLMYGDRAGLEHDAAALAEAQGDAEREEKILFRAYMGKNALHGIVESRSFTSTWLQGLKSMVFAARGGG
ncbi:hypothetical protein [Gemmobacter aquatilis]|nr:hypothetical protein [Gemmobacter aquatilis]